MRTLVLVAVLPVIAGASLATAHAQDISNLGSPRAIQIAETVIIAPSAPPPLRVETIPPAPSQVVVWEPGRWAWNGNGWQWIAGRYVQPPQSQEAWVPGHWDQQGQGWAWVDGHWE